MHVLVLSPLSFPSLGKYLPDWSQAPKLNLEVEIHDHPKAGARKPDAIICMSVSRTTEAFTARALWPDVPLFVFHWDCYSWTWIRPRTNEYNYSAYGELLKRATEVWVPSVCTGRQASLWWDLHRWIVIHPAVQVPALTMPVNDSGYLYCALRTLPDHWAPRFVQACEELNLPYRCSDHKPAHRDYQTLIAECRCIVNHYTEASTGGLTLLEAYALGKPVICTDSEWNGAREYFGYRATYFRHGDYAHFKEVLQRCYDDPPKPRRDQAEWVRETFSDFNMIRRITERLHAYVS